MARELEGNIRKRAGRDTEQLEGRGGTVPSMGASFCGLSIASGISEYTGTLKRITPAASDSNTCLTFIEIVIAVIWTLFAFCWYHWGTRGSGSLKLIARVKC
jgi:hypothetical protein